MSNLSIMLIVAPIATIAIASDDEVGEMSKGLEV
jgi:hypothetical protein